MHRMHFMFDGSARPYMITVFQGVAPLMPKLDSVTCETQETIEAWANLTFGPNRTVPVMLARATQEMAELLLAVHQVTPDLDRIAMECADVCIVLCRPSALLGHDITVIMNHIGFDGSRGFLRHAITANSRLAQCVAHYNEPNFFLPFVLDDIVTQMGQCCAAAGRILGVMVSKKMSINKGRVWKLFGDGTGQHIDLASP